VTIPGPYHAVTTGRHGTDRVRGEDSRKGVHIHNPRLRLSGVGLMYSTRIYYVDTEVPGAGNILYN
jgi:hypothetical protein